MQTETYDYEKQNLIEYLQSTGTQGMYAETECSFMGLAFEAILQSERFIKLTPYERGNILKQYEALKTTLLFINNFVSMHPGESVLEYEAAMLQYNQSLTIAAIVN